MPVRDFSRVRLGRNPKRLDPRTLQLADYVTPALPSPPHSHSWTHGLNSFGELLNDNLGDCVIAASGHAVQIWSANASTEDTISDQVVLGAYESWCGYVDGDPSTDNGCNMLSVLNNWHHSGLGGVALTAFAAADYADLTLTKQAIMLLGGVYIGLNLPLTAQTQISAGEDWDVVPGGGADAEPGSWGGHSIFVPQFDGDANTVHGLTGITWGQLQRMTKAFWEAYVDESYALISPAWIGESGQAPSGFDLAALLTDLAAIKSQKLGGVSTLAGHEWVIPHEEIAREAYRIWQEDGGGWTSEATADANWYTAERVLREWHHHHHQRLELRDPK